ncbi:hypothetical protein NQZ68_012372 [Dissostichus eleginoides]|nr:hypothetical protein NQZ68_012372 [Dissostichus eleginoides]
MQLHHQDGDSELHLKASPRFNSQSEAESRSQCGSWECVGFNTDRYFRTRSSSGAGQEETLPTALLQPAHGLKLNSERRTCIVCPGSRCSRTASDGARRAAGGSLQGCKLEGDPPEHRVRPPVCVHLTSCLLCPVTKRIKVSLDSILFTSPGFTYSNDNGLNLQRGRATHNLPQISYM